MGWVQIAAGRCAAGLLVAAQLVVLLSSVLSCNSSLASTGTAEGEELEADEMVGVPAASGTDGDPSATAGVGGSAQSPQPGVDPSDSRTPESASGAEVTEPVIEELYATGTGGPGIVDHIHIVGETLYWGQRARVMRAPKDGSGTPVIFGKWQTTNAGSIIRNDDTHLYWRDAGTIRRKRLDSEKVSLVNDVMLPVDFAHREEIEDLVTDVEYPRSLELDATFVYLAGAGCSPLVRWEKKAPAPEVFEFEDVQPLGVGTVMANSDTSLFCGNRQRIYAFNKGTEAYSQVASTEEGRFVRSMAASAGALYWLEQGSGISLPMLRKMDRSTLSVENLGMPPEFGIGHPHTPLQILEGGRSLYWLGRGTLLALTRYSLDTSTFEVKKIVTLSDAMLGDEQHLYWAGAATRDIHRRIVRVPLPWD